MKIGQMIVNLGVSTVMEIKGTLTHNFELKYNKSEPPEAPPMRRYRAGFADVLINEWESVDWYTSIGKLYPYERKFPQFWFFRLFMSEHELKLENSLKINKEICREWPR